MSNQIFGRDRDGDGDTDFADLPGYDNIDDSQRRDAHRSLDELSEAESQREFDREYGKKETWDAPVEDERSNLRRLKSLRASDLREEKLKRDQEAKDDAFIEQELKQGKKPSTLSSIGGMLSGVGRSMIPARQQQLPPSRGRGYQPSPRGRQAQPQPQRYQSPHQRSMSERFTGMNNGLDSFASGMLGGGRSAPYQGGSRVNIGGSDLTSFSRGLLGMGSSTPAPAVRQEPRYEKVTRYKKVSSPQPRREPSESRLKSFNASVLGISGGKKGKGKKGGKPGQINFLRLI